jgi:hypothetical protein
MRAARLLLAAPAATALVLTGISPAWAGDDGNGHHNGDDASAEVLSIDDEAELEDDGDEIEVRFEYKCEEDDKDSVTADVELKNHDVRYEKDDVDLRCDGDEHWKSVDLDKKKDEAKEGKEYDVTVTINENGDELDSLTEEVEVVDEENGDDNGRKDHDHDDDKDHHDPH